MDYKEIYNQWLENPYFDEATKEELKAIKDDENEIKERFYMDLEFGTAGLRGIIGAGTNRSRLISLRHFVRHRSFPLQYVIWAVWQVST